MGAVQIGERDCEIIQREHRLLQEQMASVESELRAVVSELHLLRNAENAGLSAMAESRKAGFLRRRSLTYGGGGSVVCSKVKQKWRSKVGDNNIDSTSDSDSDLSHEESQRRKSTGDISKMRDGNHWMDETGSQSVTAGSHGPFNSQVFNLLGSAGVYLLKSLVGFVGLVGRVGRAF